MTRLPIALSAVTLATLAGCNGSGRLVSVDVSNTLPATEEAEAADAGIFVVVAPPSIASRPPGPFPPVPDNLVDAGFDAGEIDATMVDAAADSEAQAIPPPIAEGGGVAVGGGCYSVEGEWCGATGHPNLVGLDRPLVCLNPAVDALDGCESVPVPASGNSAGYAFSYWCCTPLPADAGPEDAGPEDAGAD